MSEFALSTELRIGASVLPPQGDATRQMSRWADRAEALEQALRDAIEIIEWCGLNDKTPTYTYERDLKSTARRDGTLPKPGKAFNTPAELARYWPEKLRAALGEREYDVPGAGQAGC